MKCSEAENMMEQYLDESLYYRELDRFLTHIDGCDICRDDLEMRYIIRYGLSDEYDDNKGTYDFVSLFKADYERAKKAIDDKKKMQFYRSVRWVIANLIVAVTFFVMLMRY